MFLVLLGNARLVREVVGVLHPTDGVREVHVTALKVRRAETADRLSHVQLKPANKDVKYKRERKTSRAGKAGFLPRGARPNKIRKSNLGEPNVKPKNVHFWALVAGGLHEVPPHFVPKQ